MMTTKKLLIISVLLLGVIWFAQPVLAQVDPSGSACTGISAAGANCNTAEEGVGSFLVSVVNTLLFVVGAASVIMIVIGGIRYVISGGDSNATTSAKNTIMYAAIGLVVAFLAYAAVNFVLARLGA